MSFFYWIFGVGDSLRQSMPSLSVHDDGLSRGWIFILSLILLAILLWVCRQASPTLKAWQVATLAALRWAFFIGLFFILVHPVLVLAGEEVPGLPEMEIINLSSSPWVFVTMLVLLAGEWCLRRNWSLK